MFYLILSVYVDVLLSEMNLLYNSKHVLIIPSLIKHFFLFKMINQVIA